MYVDNKAIALIYNNRLANPPARIKRWKLRLSSFDFEVIHIPGTSNIADFMSRHPMAARKEDLDQSENYIQAVTILSLPRTVMKQDILIEPYMALLD